jgi:hypothetical protein
MGRALAVAIATIIAWAAPARAAHHRPNMPDGWRWPPSREMRQDGRRCLAELRAMGVQYKRVARRRKITTPIVVPAMRFGSLALVPTYRKPPFVMDCRLARGLAQYAELITSLGVSELRFSTIHEYRRVRTRGPGKKALSRHALGLAMDVFELGLADGRRVVVKDEYWIHPILVMTELALRATGGFRAILSPSVDPGAHGDHLHLEIAVEYPGGAEKQKRDQEKKRKKKKKKKKKRKRRRGHDSSEGVAQPTTSPADVTGDSPTQSTPAENDSSVLGRGTERRR